MPESKWDISRLSAGERSALKRNAGTMMHAASMQSIEGYYRALLARCGSYTESIWFAAMCMQCLWKEEEHPVIKPFPEILRLFYQDPEATDSTRKRCTGFMDINWSEDGFLLGKICNLVRKIHSERPDMIPDFEALADDLTQWNHESHYIQRKWLNTICRTAAEDKKEEKKNAD